MKGTDEVYELIAKKLSGEISIEEQEFLNQWQASSAANEELFKKFETIWTESSGYAGDFNPDLSKAISRYKKRVEASIKTKRSKR
jgi:hypothetical protein